MALTPAGRVLLAETGLLFDGSTRRSPGAPRAAGQEGELRLAHRSADAAFRRCWRNSRGVARRSRCISKSARPNASGNGGARRLDLGLTPRPRSRRYAWRLCCCAMNGSASPSRAAMPGAKAIVAWRQLAGQPLIILARAEGAGRTDAVSPDRAAAFTPRLVHTPSVISTVLRYVEAGAGLASTRELGEIEDSPRWINTRIRRAARHGLERRARRTWSPPSATSSANGSTPENWPQTMEQRAPAAVENARRKLSDRASHLGMYFARRLVQRLKHALHGALARAANGYPGRLMPVALTVLSCLLAVTIRRAKSRRQFPPRRCTMSSSSRARCIGQFP